MNFLRTGLVVTLLSGPLLHGQQLNPLTNEFRVNQQIDGPQDLPHVASDTDGSYVITWTTGTNTIMARRYGADHQALTDEIQVASGERAFVYRWSEGRFIIAWKGTPSGMKVLQADNTLSATYPVGSSTEVDLCVQGDVMLVAYSSSPHIHLRKWDLLTQAWAGPAVQASETASNNYKLPQVRWTSDGSVVLIYANASGTRKIYRKTFNADLLALTPETSLLSTSGSVNVINVSINVHDQLLIYAKLGVNGTDHFWGQVLDAQGNELVESVGSTSAPYAQFHTDCELFDDGAMVLTNNYKTSLNDPDNFNVRANYVAGLNGAQTGWHVASNTVGGEQRYPAVAKLPNGGFIMAWSGNGFQGDSDGVYARAFGRAFFPGVATTTPLPLVVDETGTTEMLALRLGSQPTGDVVVDLSVSEPTEVAIGTQQLTFTPANWDQVQQVAVTGLDDSEDDGDISLHVIAAMNAATADPAYAAMPPAFFAVVNRDDDATFTLPTGMSFCRTTGSGTIVLKVTNNGDPVGQPVLGSSDQAILPDTALHVVQLNDSLFQTHISALPGHQTGTASVTLTVTDGSFIYSEAFDVTTLGSTPTITWQNMQLVSTPAAAYQWYLDGAVIAGAEQQAWTPAANGQYSVRTTDADGCSEESEEHFFGTLGMGPIEQANGPQLYPMPVQGTLTVANVRMGQTFRLHAANGQQVAEFVVRSQPAQFDLSGLPAGLYMLRPVDPAAGGLPVMVR